MIYRKSDKSEKLKELENIVSKCDSCKLHTTRNKIVFGEGNPGTKLMFIGEGPGREEDQQGRPFIGRSGQFLTDIIEQELKLKRSDVYIANIVKCRPTVDMEGKKDRQPDDDEINTCTPYLMAQIDIIQPRIIVTLGAPATKLILGVTLGITKIHGNWYKLGDADVLPMYHPSYVLRNGGHTGSLKEDVVNDIGEVYQKYIEVMSEYVKC